MLLRATHYRTHQRIDIRCRDGTIESIGPADPFARPEREGGTIAPGLFDIQINGALGVGFNSSNLDEAGIRRVADACREHAIHRFCPTIITDGYEAVERSLKTLRKAIDGDIALKRALCGFHLEGPYISPEDGPRGRTRAGTSGPPTGTNSAAGRTRRAGPSGW